MKDNLCTLSRILARICFLFLFLVTILGIGITASNTSSESVTSLQHVWTDETGEPFQLNQFQYTNRTDSEGKKIYYTLPNVANNTIIMFRCRNMFINIYRNGERIYQDKQTLPTIFGTSPGSRWHTISLNSSTEPVLLCLEGFGCFTDSDGLIDNIYIGEPTKVYRKIVSSRFFSFCVALGLLFLGFVLLILCIAFFNKRRDLCLDLFYLGTAILCASSWAITESLLCQLFFARSEVIHLITYASLIIIPLPFALLAAHRFTGKLKLFSMVYAIVNCANILLVTFLHITGIREYHYTLTPTHVLFVFLIPLILGLLLSYIKYKENQKKTWHLVIPALVIVAVCLITALTEYVLGWFGDYSDYTQIALITFMTCLVIYHLQQMVDVLQKGMQADVLHKLALTDHLTGLYNRTAFAEHQKQYLETMMKNSVLGIIQFDVNNLKTVNDTFGHEKGDYLIQLVSEGLSTSFAEAGNCYRMGGDEFLVILTGDVPQKDYEYGMRLLHTYCTAHNTQKNIEFPIVIAHGFVMEYGLTLSEAIEKADALMYENKKALKFKDRKEKRQPL